MNEFNVTDKGVEVDLKDGGKSVVTLGDVNVLIGNIDERIIDLQQQKVKLLGYVTEITGLKAAKL